MIEFLTQDANSQRTQYKFFHLQHSFEGNYSLIGPRVDYNVTRFLSLNAQVDFGLNGPPRFSSKIEGGSMMLGLFGVKAGKRFEHFGVFGQIRPGFVTVSRATTKLDFQRYVMEDGRLTSTAVNLGAVFEYYPVHRLGFRFDLGDTLIHYPKRNIVVGWEPLHGFTSHNTDLSAGFFYRF